VGKRTFVFFTPDSCALIISRGEEFSFWDVKTFRLLRRLPRESNQYPGWVTFTADGKLMALEMAPGVMHLVETASGRTVAHLTDPDGDRATWQAFTPDGTRLVVLAGYSSAVHIWDLRAIRTRLKQMNLDWDWPEAATAGQAAMVLNVNEPLLAEQKKQAADDPDDRAWQADLAAGQHAFAMVQLGQGKLDEAEQMVRQAVATRERLAQGEPKNLIRLGELADTWMLLGNLLWRKGRFAEGAQSWQKTARALEARTNLDADARGAQETSARCRALGFTYIKAGLWSEATACFERLPGQDWDCCHTAILQLRTGNIAGYRQTCRAVRGLLEKAEKPEQIYGGYLWTCALDNRAEVDAEQLHQKAKQVEEAYHQNWLQFLRALAGYRAGRFEEALAWATKSNASASWAGRNMNWPVLALAHHRLHHDGEARKWLEQANLEWRRLSPLAQSIQAANVLPFHDPPWWQHEHYWHDWITFELLLTEANALILGQGGEADCLELLHEAYLRTKLGENEKANALFQAAVHGRAKEAGAWLARGRVYLLLDDKEPAKTDFARAHELNPDDPQIQKEYEASRGEKKNGR
jgi:tetratricopeptide (TPR) repeat protein